MDMTFDESILYKVDNHKVASEMADMLMDNDITTYDMFEDLVIGYVNGNKDYREGMDKVLRTLIWKDMNDLVQYVIENCTEV